MRNSIEYNEIPPPECLIKAMDRIYAEKLVSSGELRINNLDYFRKWENSELGDQNDGLGLYQLDGRDMNFDTMNSMYALCMSLPQITGDRINILSKEVGYNCCVIIRNPDLFFQMIKKQLLIKYPNFHIQCGIVKYDRGQEADKLKLNSQPFNYNVFQKAPSFKEDLEYRLSITNYPDATTNYTETVLDDEYIELEIGNCSEIILIDELPNNYS